MDKIGFKIIVEGPNNVGKSTFIRKLQERNLFKNYEVEHLSSKTPNTKEFHEDLLKLPQNMIFDRFYIGELVYPEIYNRKSKLTLADVRDLAKKYDSTTIIIVLDADYEFIIQSNKNKNEEFNYEEVKKEKDGFYKIRTAIEESGVKVLHYKNKTKDNEQDYEDFLDKIEMLVINKIDSKYMKQIKSKLGEK